MADVRTINFPMTYNLRKRIEDERMTVDDQKVWEKKAPQALDDLTTEAGKQLATLLSEGYTIVAQSQIEANYMTKLFMVLYRP